MILILTTTFQSLYERWLSVDGGRGVALLAVIVVSSRALVPVRDTIQFVTSP